MIYLNRIFAGSLIALLLSVSSLAAACDLSCGFAQVRSDCHSSQLEARNSSGADMDTSDAAMAGMAMPGEASASFPDQGTVSARLQMEMHRAQIGEMGPCERQSCNPYAANPAKLTRLDAPQFHTIFEIYFLSHTSRLKTTFYDARNDVPVFIPDNRVPLSIRLRI